jgi:hypothetical protein
MTLSTGTGRRPYPEGRPYSPQLRFHPFPYPYLGDNKSF